MADVGGELVRGAVKGTWVYNVTMKRDVE